MESYFTNVYENKIWGNNNESGYAGSSGGGSDVDVNKDTYIPFLKRFIMEKDIKTIVDLGCGDFRCGPLIYNDLDVLYTGYDTYKKVVEFNAEKHSMPKYSFFAISVPTHLSTHALNLPLTFTSDASETSHSPNPSF